MQPIAVIAGFTPKSEHRDRVREVLAGMVEPTRAEPGCLQYDLYESTDGFHLFERYLDRSAIAAHQETSHYQFYRASIAELLSAPISVAVADPIDVA